MKLLISSILAIVIGVLSAIFIPLSSGMESFIDQFSAISLNLGRYVIFPIVFFSLAIAVCKQRREKKLLKSTLLTLAFSLSATIILVVFGILITLLFSPERIPLIVETESQFATQEQVDIFLALFPRNMFTIFTGSSNVLLPLYVLSFALGFIMYKDREVAEPTFNLFDSLSRILYDLNMIITTITPVLLLGLSYNLASSLKDIAEPSMFYNLFLTLTIASLSVLFLVYPLIIYITDKKKRNPYVTIYKLIPALMTGLISGDSYFSLSMLTRSLKKDLKVSRKTAALTLPFNAMFTKAGTALVTSITFLTILKSYSSLEITLYQILWVTLFSILISFTLFSIPALGAYTALYFLSDLYSRSHSGLSDSYLLIKPIVPLLIGFAVFIDVATSAIITLLVNRGTEES